MGYRELAVEVKLAADNIKLTKERHAREVWILEQDHAKQLEKLQAIEGGFDEGVYDLAAPVLEVEGDLAKALHYMDGAGVIQDAIEQLRLGGLKLRTTRLAVKRYDAWACQRSDAQYGYGPRHGSIWFSIGLKGGHRGADLGQLDENVSLACVRMLRHLVDKATADS